MVLVLVDMEVVPPAPHLARVHLDRLPIGVDVVVPEKRRQVFNPCTEFYQYTLVLQGFPIVLAEQCL